MGADFTVAVMVKPDSPGETLTRRLAGERYAGFDLKMFNNDMDKVCGEIAEAVAGNILSARKGDGEDYVLNVAGNRLSIFMRSGYSQDVLNRLFCDVFSRLRTKLAGVSSGRVVILTGGQGGADEAAIVGALANGFPARVHAPAGWAYSGADGVTVYDEAGFKERFDDRIIEAYGILAGNSAGVGGPSFEPMFNNGGPWIRDEVAADSRGLYLFGDNMDRSSGSGVVPAGSDYARMYGAGKTLFYPNVTAAVIRGLDNAMPVCTQHRYRKGSDFTGNRWTDADLAEFKAVIGREFRNIKEKFVRGGYHYVVLPGNGFFDSRIANISRSRCPALYDALSAELDSLRSFVGEHRVRFGWARYSDNGYELSLRGDRRFSAMYARMNPGTELFGVDVGGITVEDIYQKVVKRSGKGCAPAADSMVYAPGVSKDLAEELSYRKGYLPIWLEWARQNPVFVDRLRIMAAGKVLTDAFASTGVSQARALADILNGDAPKMVIPLKEHAAVAAAQEEACTVKVAFSPEVRSSIFLVERDASVSGEGAVHSFFEYAGELVHVGCLDDSGRWYCRVEGRKGYLLSSFGDDGITVYDSFEAGYDTAPLAEMFRGLVEKAEAERLEVQTGQSRGRGI